MAESDIVDPSDIINVYLNAGEKPDDAHLDDLGIAIIALLDDYESDFAPLADFMDFITPMYYKWEDRVWALIEAVKSPPKGFRTPWWHPLSKLLLAAEFGKEVLPLLGFEVNFIIDAEQRHGPYGIPENWARENLFSEYGSGWNFGLAAASNGVVLGEWLDGLAKDEVSDVEEDEWTITGNYDAGQMNIDFQLDRRDEELLLILAGRAAVKKGTPAPKDPGFTPTLISYCLALWFHALEDLHSGLADDELHSNMTMEQDVKNVEEEYHGYVVDGAPENWAGQVIGWLVENAEQEQTESRDDGGMWPDEGPVIDALRDLGWLDPYYDDDPAH